MADLSTAYQRKTHREHILDLPDTYIGSVTTANEVAFLREGDEFKEAPIALNPGFYKLIDELLVNAHDQVVRLRSRQSTNPVKNIDITCSDISFNIKNDGEPIDVAEHPEHKTWIPQMIFGELLTSTNYDKNEKKLVGGKNGYGVKLVNIFAREMKVTVVDQPRGLTYTQTFRNNMTVVETPRVATSKAKSSVCVQWEPDFARFGMKGIDTGMQRLIERRVWDLAMTLGKEVKVTFNGTAVKCKNLTEYAKAFGCDPVIY